MKVLHIGKFYPPFYGGIERVNFDLVENLNRIPNCTVDELCFHHSVGNEPFAAPTNYKLFRATIRAIRFSTPISSEYFSIFRKIHNNYDIIHLHMPNPLAALALLIFPSRAKLVLHWHSDIVKQKKLRLLYYPFQVLLLKRANRIIVTSRNYFGASQELQPYKHKISVIPIGIGMEHLAFEQKDAEKIRERYTGKKIVLSIGRLTYYKGFDYLVDAALSLPDDTVVLIGGCGELKNELQARINRHGLGKRVKLIGKIPQREMGAYYAAADLFCLPSIVRTEAFGVVLLEAMSMGLPIVACDIPGSGVNWVNSHGETGLNVPVRNSSALAEAIGRMLDSSVHVSFSARSKKRYETLFTLNRMVNEVYKLYRSLI